MTREFCPNAGTRPVSAKKNLLRTSGQGMEKAALNVGAGHGWKKSGWATTDHKRRLLTGGSAWRLDYPDHSFELLFSSHMLEHIPHFKIDAVISEFNRVMKPGAVIRLLCPDLETLARAYVEKNNAHFDDLLAEDKTIRTDLGAGGTLVNFIVSGGSDMLMLSRNGECIGGYAHVYAYDFEMLRILLERHGFGDVTRCEFLVSRCEEFREPLHPIGQQATWVRESDWGDRSRGLTGFDRDPLCSLIVEAVKVERVPFRERRFGSVGVRGLDPDTFSWKDITAAYLGFSWWKLRRVPRAILVATFRGLRKLVPAVSRSRLKRLVPTSVGAWIEKF